MKSNMLVAIFLTGILGCGGLSFGARNLIANVEAAVPGPQTATPPGADRFSGRTNSNSRRADSISRAENGHAEIPNCDSGGANAHSHSSGS